jgi:lipoprotein-anchoring transpeptidase ErfK/SrfK
MRPAIGRRGLTAAGGSGTSGGWPRRLSRGAWALPAAAAAVALIAGCQPMSTAQGAASHGPAPAAPAATAPASPQPAPSPTPTITQGLAAGMKGPAVLALQQRLAALKYYPGPADGQFGTDTQEAVWAFQEAQGLPVTGTIGPQTLAALASPRSPAVLAPDAGATRVEVNLADQLLVLYRDGQPALISHVSSGGGYKFCSDNGCGYAVTPTGTYHTLSYIPGWIHVPLGEMYNSVFFLGTSFAIHGDTSVPLQPASHGCVRIPMDIAQFFHTLVPVPGTPVIIHA